MNEPAYPHIGVGTICSRGGKVLLLHRAYAHGAGSWSTPGGHLEMGETPVDCAVRELWEETGIQVVNPRFIAITNDIFTQENKHYITIWIQVDHSSGEPTLTAPEESTEVGWFDWHYLPYPLFLPLQHLLSGQSEPKYPDIVKHIISNEKP